MTDLLSALLDACDRASESPAITRGRHSLSFGDLGRRVRRTADSLLRLGMAPGDRVLFSVRPGPDGIVLALGIVLAGGTVVFADPGQGESLFRARAALAGPRWVAAESLLYALSTRALRALARSRGLELPDYRSVVPEARHLVAGIRLPGVPSGAIPVRRLADARSDRLSSEPSRWSSEPFRWSSDVETPALIIFTSGTTEAPKAVVHSRRSLGAGLGDFARAVGFRPGERVLTDQLMVGIPALIAGAHWELPPPGLDPGARPERFVRLLPRADVLFAVPAALDAILTQLERRSGVGPQPRCIVLGGAPVLRPLLERARERFPAATIRAVYGMTEMLPVAIADGDEKLAWRGAGDLVGTIVPSVRARIVDGELVVAGEGLADYLDAPLDELATGDLARIEGDRLVLAGRAKEMFIRGTTNVYPGLYEPVICGIPGVREAALVGVPDEIGDDRLVLAVVLDGTTPDRVRAALPGLIDAAVLPDDVVALDALPRSGRSRKLDRRALAELVR